MQPWHIGLKPNSDLPSPRGLCPGMSPNTGPRMAPGRWVQLHPAYCWYWHSVFVLLLQAAAAAAEPALPSTESTPPAGLGLHMWDAKLLTCCLCLAHRCSCTRKKRSCSLPWHAQEALCWDVRRLVQG